MIKTMICILLAIIICGLSLTATIYFVGGVIAAIKAIWKVMHDGD